MKNSVFRHNLDTIPTENLPYLLIFNENQVWHKTWNLYVTVAQNSTTNDSKRHAFLQLAEDVKQQYTKTIEQEGVHKKKSFKLIKTLLKWRAEPSISGYSSKNHSLLHSPLCFRMVIVILVMLILIVMFSGDNRENMSYKQPNYYCSMCDITTVSTSLPVSPTMTNSLTVHIFLKALIKKKLAFTSSAYTNTVMRIKTISTIPSLTTTYTSIRTSITLKTETSTTTSTTSSTTTTTETTTSSSTSIISGTTTIQTIGETTTNIVNSEPGKTITSTENERRPTPTTSTNRDIIATLPTTDTDIITNNLKTSIAIYDKPISQNLIQPIANWFISVYFLLIIFCFIISFWLELRQIIIFICYVPCRLYRLICTHSQNINLPLIHKMEKLVLLDSMKQYSHLSTLFQNNLLVYSSIYDCFHQLASNHLQDYILFLSLTTFEVHSFELGRLSNVSLCIFYEDNDHSHPHLSKTKYHIRFIFPKACLLEYLRHAVILNYAKQAHMYRLEGLEREADENYLAASHECHRLADELEQQSSTIGGREPEESLSHDGEDMNDRYLR